MRDLKCICHDISIKEIRRQAEEKNLIGLEEVLENINCGKGCKLCHPYIEECLRLKI